MLCYQVEYKERHSGVRLNLRYWLVEFNHSKVHFFKCEIHHTYVHVSVTRLAGQSPESYIAAYLRR